MIIGIGYKKGSGKDTLAHIIEGMTQKPCVLESFALGVKSALIDLFPQVGYRNLYTDKNDLINGLTIPTTGEIATGRTLMQYFGTDVCRKIYNDIWVNQLVKRASKQEGKLIIACDVRFENEARAILDNDGLLIRVDRETEPDSHESENSLNDFKDWSIIIDNNGDMDHLTQQCENKLKGIL